MKLPALGMIVLLAVGATPLHAQRPVREARSENGRFVLRIAPGQPGRAGQSCQATLYERAERADADRRIWERPLVNDVGPLQAFVRDDGQFVITLDEHRRAGARHALVIYGAHGELLRHFLLMDLLDQDDWPHVKVSRREVLWLRDARCTFDVPGDQFIIDLAWGRKLRIDLRTLRVVREAAGADTAAAATIPAEILAQLFDHVPTGAAPRTGLAELTPEEQAQTSAIAEQLSGSTAPTTSPATQPVPASSTAAASATGEPPAESAGSASFAPGPTDLVVPPPDAAHKVDYVAWLNQRGHLDGPDARPLYDAAIAQLTPWPGSAELLAAAARGDAAALGSPELAAWLTANAGALAKFSEAAQYPAKGWSLHSGDGTALGVLLPDLAPLRTLARAAIVEGRELVARGQPAQAAERYLAAGAHTGSGLTLIENLGGMAMQAPAADALLDLQAEPSASALDYAALSRDAELAYRPTRAAPEAIQGERAFFMDAVQRVWDVDPQTGQCTLNADQAGQLLTLVEGESADPAQLTHDLAQLEEIGYDQTVALGTAYYDTLSAALALPYPQASQRIAEIEQTMLSSAHSHPFLRRLTPSLSRYAFLKARGDTTRHAALLVTHLHAYRQEHGEYPASLAIFADREFAVDPFSAAPFVYRRAGDDFVLYSVGGNGVDDSGVHDRRGEANDLVFWPRAK
jgi:hypothetical protein